MTNRPRTKAPPPRILVAVADEVLARALADPLADAGFAVTRLGNLSDVASVPADLVVVDRAASLEGDDALLAAAG
ncbi:hypothetical protein, partial [Zavarzinia sp.]|uniref:hypothetical protein n=1 Tax=Zavarzinia sp. TaxID=2027920 RepID=UPI003BB7512C